MVKLWQTRLDSSKLCELGAEPCMAFSREAGLKAAAREHARLGHDGMVLVRPADAIECPGCASRILATPIRSRA